MDEFCGTIILTFASCYLPVSLQSLCILNPGPGHAPRDAGFSFRNPVSILWLISTNVTVTFYDGTGRHACFLQSTVPTRALSPGTSWRAQCGAMLLNEPSSLQILGQQILFQSAAASGSTLST
jgi:hypothetical protein